MFILAGTLSTALLVFIPYPACYRCRQPPLSLVHPAAPCSAPARQQPDPPTTSRERRGVRGRRRGVKEAKTGGGHYYVNV